MVVMQDVDCRTPIHAPSLLAFFAARAVPGVEAVDGTVYRRSVALAHGPGVLALELGEAPRWALERGDPRDEAEAARLAAALLDADADPAAVDGALAADPLLRELVARRARPARAGLRRPGRDRRPRRARPAGQRRRRAHAGGPADRAARRAAARARRRRHPPVPGPAGARRARPRGAADAARPRPLARRDGRRASRTGSTRATATPSSRSRGIGPWTADYVAMRCGDRDVLLETDLGVRRGFARIADPAQLIRRAEAWRPWRSYAVQHLWSLA